MRQSIQFKGARWSRMSVGKIQKLKTNKQKPPKTKDSEKKKQVTLEVLESSFTCAAPY